MTILGCQICQVTRVRQNPGTGTDKWSHKPTGEKRSLESLSSIAVLGTYHREFQTLTFAPRTSGGRLQEPDVSDRALLRWQCPTTLCSVFHSEQKLWYVQVQNLSCTASCVLQDV